MAQTGQRHLQAGDRDIEEINSEVFAGLGENDTPTDEQATAFVEQFVPLIEGAVSSIDALEEPGALKKDVKKFKSVVGQALDELEANPTGYVDAPASDDPFVKVGKVAQRLGLKACA